MKVKALRWGLLLKGHEADLQEWRRAFGPVSDPFVEDGEHGLVLWSAQLQSASSTLEVWEDCASLLRQINSVMMHAANCRRVERDCIIERGTDGSLRRHVVIQPIGFELRAILGIPTLQLFDSEGNLIPPPPPKPSNEQLWLRAAAESDQLAELLTYAFERESWFEVYKAIEVMENILGGERHLVEFAGEHGPNVKALKRNANFHRHATGNGERPTKLMTLNDANLLLSELVGKIFRRHLRLSDGL